MQKEDRRPVWRTGLARAARAAALGLTCALSAASVAACPPAQGPHGGSPEETCTRACIHRAASHCTEDDCGRGCRFVLDRLAEHEGDRVIDCVARTAGACGDALFAECAVMIGEHADGGPPPPPPPDDL
jgi:hypothetical protein